MGSILTNTGRIKLASATPEDQLNVTQIAVGDGNGGFPDLTPDMTGLTNEVWRGTVSDPIRSDDETTIIFEGFIASSIGGFYVREVAIFDEDGDMIAIGHTSEIEKPDPDSGNPASLSIRLHVALSSAEQVDLIYNDSPTIDHSGLSNRDSSDSHPSSAISTDALTGIGQDESNVAAILALLKTAALRNAQTSSTDETAGSLLQVGAFGLGANPVSNSDWDSITATGFYTNSESSQSELPAAYDEINLIHIENENNATQIALRSNSTTPTTWHRSRDFNGWGDWKTFLDSDTSHNSLLNRDTSNSHPATAIQTSALTGLGVTSNSTVQSILGLLKSAAKLESQSSKTDGTENRLMLVGAFGHGGEAIVNSSWDDISVSGLYVNFTATQTELPEERTGIALQHIQISDSRAIQYAWDTYREQPLSWQRSKRDGVWGSWFEMHTQSNNDEVGCIKYFITTVTPTGRYIKANGAAVSRTAYADLFAKVGTFWGEGDGSTTFNVPDLRGEFIRTWDDGRGLDSGRSFGVVQDGQIEAHTHGTVTNSSIGTDSGTARTVANYDGTAETESYGGSETRPRNISLIAWIRY